MAKGGARPGAGRPKGSTNLLNIRDYMDEMEVSKFMQWLIANYPKDTRLAVWMADRLFGKAPQPVTGADGGPIEITGVSINVRKA